MDTRPETKARSTRGRWPSVSDDRKTPEESFERLCRTLLAEPDVTRESDSSQRRGGFGSSALKVNGKIFAMLVGGQLVVKLPRHQVDSLVMLGEGEHFTAGKGRPMREWLVLRSRSEYQWERWARESLAFVAQQKAA